MGMVYKKAYTMPAPPGAEIVERDGKRVARWRLRNGQLRTAEVVDGKNGKLRVRGQSRLHLARYLSGTAAPPSCHVLIDTLQRRQPRQGRPRSAFFTGRNATPRQPACVLPCTKPCTYARPRPSTLVVCWQNGRLIGLVGNARRDRRNSRPRQTKAAVVACGQRRSRQAGDRT